MRAKSDSQLFSNISATTALFTLTGGKYRVAVVATFGGGTVKLQTVLPDGSTLLSIGSSTDFSAAGVVILDLGPGKYQFTVATASAIYAEIVRVPGE